MKRSFEDFLKDYHMKYYVGTDDDSVDAFESWMSEQDVESMEVLGNLYGKEMFLRGMDHSINIIKTAV